MTHSLIIRKTNNVESGADFINKFGIPQKEYNEILNWLEVLKATGYLTTIAYESITKYSTELLKIIKSIILTRKANLKVKDTNKP